MVGVKGDDLVQRRAELFEHRVQRLDLGGVARVAIENPAVLGVIHGQTVLDDLVGELVGHQFALVGVLQRLKAELSLVLDVVAEDVAGRDGGDAVVLGEQGGLGALADTLRAHNQQSHVVSLVK